MFRRRYSIRVTSHYAIPCARNLMGFDMPCEADVTEFVCRDRDAESNMRAVVFPEAIGDEAAGDHFVFRGSDGAVATFPLSMGGKTVVGYNEVIPTALDEMEEVASPTFRSRLQRALEYYLGREALAQGGSRTEAP
jgi:hypothetical protein